MKKLVLTTVCAMSMAGAAFSQGLLNWATAPSLNFIVATNTGGSVFTAGTQLGGVSGTAQAGAAGPGFYLDLLYGGQNTTGVAVTVPNSLNALLTGWKTTGLYATNALATTVNGRVGFVNPNGAATVPWGGNTDSPGQTNNIMMAGWSANLGSDWLTVSNNLANWDTLGGSIVGAAYFGLSSTGFLVGNDSPASGATLFNNGQTPNGLPFYQPAANPMTLYLLNVPEPATMALFGLGGLSLMLFRRQRK